MYTSPPLRPWLLLLALLAGGVPARADDKTLPAKYLLDDTDAVIVVNVRQIVKSPLFAQNFKKDVAAWLQQKDVRKWLDGIGFDPLRDIDRVTLVSGRSCHVDPPNPGTGPLIVIEGHFDPEKFHAKGGHLVKDMPGRLRAHAVGDATVYELFEQVGEPVGFAAMPDRNTLVLAPRKDQVVLALEKAAGKKKTALEYPTMRAVLKGLDPERAVGLVGVKQMVLTTKVKLVHKGGKAVAEEVKHSTLGDYGVESLRGGFTVGDDIRGRVRLTAEGEPQARKLARFLIGLRDALAGGARKAAGTDKELLPVARALEAVKVRRDGQTVVLEGRAGAGLVRGLLGLALGGKNGRPDTNK